MSIVRTVQNTILAQAAGRAYPERYRLLGGTIERPAATDADPLVPGLMRRTTHEHSDVKERDDE